MPSSSCLKGLGLRAFSYLFAVHLAILYCLGLIRYSPALRLLQISSTTVFFKLLPLLVGCFTCWKRLLFSLEFPGLLLALVRPVNPFSCALWFDRCPICDGSCLHCWIAYFTSFVGSIVKPYHIPPPFVRVRSLTSCPCATCPLSFSAMLFLHVLGVICTNNTKSTQLVHGNT